MNALLYAINEIRAQIPTEIIHAAMMIDEPEVTAKLTSLDDKLLNKVIKKRVLLDANIVGGIETILPLSQPSYYDQYYTIYNVPPEATNNREIISVLSIAFMPASGYFGQTATDFGTAGGYSNGNFNGNHQSNPVMGVARRIGDAASISGALSNAHIELVAYNTILIYANYRAVASFGVRVILENETNLNNIQPRSYKGLSLLCVLAAKSYIYGKLIIPINSGYLAGGQDLGIFKSLIENYSSAEEEYRTYLREQWAATAYMNDTTRYNRFLSSMLNPST